MDEFNPHQHQISEQLLYYINREKELLLELERKEIDAANLKDLALAYEDLEAERNNLQAELEELSHHIQPHMGESTEREVYEKKIYDILHELNVKGKECSELEGELKHLQEENISLTETIQHYEEFSNSLRTEMRAHKVTVEERNEEVNSLRQELGFLRERGGVGMGYGEEREQIMMKVQEVIAEKDQEIMGLRAHIKDLADKHPSSLSLQQATHDLTLNELKAKQSLIQNLSTRLQYLTEQNKANTTLLEIKNQEIFRLKKQMIESDSKWVTAAQAQTGPALKPRNMIDHSLTQELEGLKSLRPELEVTREVIRRKEMELLELRQNKETEILKLGNQIEELQVKLSGSNTKLEEERLLYRQWKITTENKLIKGSIKPAANPMTLVNTYEKEVSELYAKLQQSRQDYIQMRKSSEEKAIQLEVRINELLFKINETNGLLSNQKQEKQLLVKENRTFRTMIRNLKELNQGVSKGGSGIRNIGGSKGKQDGFGYEHVDGEGVGDVIGSVNERGRQYQNDGSEEIGNLKHENRELCRMIESRDVQISHLEAAVTEINSSLIEFQAKCQALQRGSNRAITEQKHHLQNKVQQLHTENLRLSQQKQLIFAQISKTQDTINQLTVKLSKLQYYNSQYQQIWQNIDALYVSANKLGVLALVLRDNQGNREDSIKKLVGIAEKIKSEVNQTLQIKERISRVQE